VHHEHRWRWTAWLCGKWQRLAKAIGLAMLVGGCAAIDRPGERAAFIGTTIAIAIIIHQQDDDTLPADQRRRIPGNPCAERPEACF